MYVDGDRGDGAWRWISPTYMSPSAGCGVPRLGGGLGEGRRSSFGAAGARGPNRIAQ